MRQYCQGVHWKYIVFEWKERKLWNQMQLTTAIKVAMRHTMTNSSTCSNSSIATQYRAAAAVHGGIYKYIAVRCTAAYSVIIIYQVQARCCEPAHGGYVTKRETTAITTHRAAAAAEAAAAPCMHIKLSSRSLRRHLNRRRTYFYTGTKKEGKCHTPKTPSYPGFEPRTPRSKGQQPTCSPTQVHIWYFIRLICIYTYE